MAPKSLKRIQSVNKHGRAERTNSDISGEIPSSRSGCIALKNINFSGLNLKMKSLDVLTIFVSVEQIQIYTQRPVKSDSPTVRPVSATVLSSSACSCVWMISLCFLSWRLHWDPLAAARAPSGVHTSHFLHINTDIWISTILYQYLNYKHLVPFTFPYAEMRPQTQMTIMMTWTCKKTITHLYFTEYVTFPLL